MLDEPTAGPRSGPGLERTPVLAAVILLALGARLAFLSAPSLWLDEAISANIAQGRLADCVREARADLHPPLYYVLLHAWSVLGHGEFALRLFSVAANVLAGGVLFLWVRRMLGPSAALLTLLLHALSPFQVRYSQEVRMYSLASLWMALALLCAWSYLARRRWPALAGYVLCSALGLYTHYQTGVFLVAANVAATVRLLGDRRVLFRRWYPAQLAVLLLFGPWVPSFLQQLTAGGRSWVPFNPSPASLASPFLAFVWGEPVVGRLRGLAHAPGARLLLAAAALALAALLTLGARRKRIRLSRPGPPILFAGIVALGAVVLSFGLSFRSNVYGPKYLMGAALAFQALLGHALVALIRRRRAAGIALLALVLLSQALMLADAQRPENRREDWRAAVAYIRGHPQRPAIVAFHFDRPMAPFVYYADGSIPAFGWVRDGRLSPAFAEAVDGRGETIWLFDYLSELYDPAGSVRRGLTERGYAPAEHRDFNGVGLTRWQKLAGP
jgi:hypothetical protein